MASMEWAGGDVQSSQPRTLRSPNQETGGSSTDPNLKNANYVVMFTQKMDIGEDAGKVRVVVGTVPQQFQITQNVAFSTPFAAGLLGDGMVGNLAAAATGSRLIAQVMTMQIWQGAGDDTTFTVTFELRAWSDPIRDVVNPLKTLLQMSMPSITPEGFMNSPGPILGEDGVKKIGGTLTGVVIDTGVAVGQAVGEIGSNSLSAVTGAFTGGATTLDGDKQFIQPVTNAYSRVKNIIAKSGIATKEAIEPLLKNKISIAIGRWFYLSNVVITNVQHDLKPQTVSGPTGQLQAATVTVSFKPMFTLTDRDIDSLLKAAPPGVASRASGPSLSSLSGVSFQSVSDIAAGVSGRF